MDSLDKPGNDRLPACADNDNYIKNFSKILNKYPVIIIASVVIPKKMPIKGNFIARLNKMASGKLNAEIAIINESAVPRGIPF